jgi:hypothetical protein
LGAGAAWFVGVLAGALGLGSGPGVVGAAAGNPIGTSLGAG